MPQAEPSIWSRNNHIIKLLFGTIIVIFINIFSITLTLRIPLLLLNITYVGVVQFFIFSSSEEQHKLPEPSIQNKNTMKMRMLFSMCTLVIVIMKTFFEAVKLTTPVFLALIGIYVLHLPTANVSFLNVRFFDKANSQWRCYLSQ